MTLAGTVQVAAEGRTAFVTLERPPLNVLDIPMMRSLSLALGQVIPRSNVIVIRGGGAKAFSAGAEVRDHTPDRVAEMLGAFHEVFRRLAVADCITVAAVHGHCLGGGCELATFCDFVIAAESATFGQPEIKLGCFPPVAMITFPRLVGPRAALDLILTGRTISAREAQQLGLVTRMVPEGALANAVEELLRELGQLSPAALRLARRGLRGRLSFDFDRSLREVEELYLSELMKTEDAPEGVRAFMEKRAPVWRGR